MGKTTSGTKYKITLVLILFVALPPALGQMMVKEMMPMADETHHLEVKPESIDGYRLPYIKVTVSIIDQETMEKKVVELQPMFGGNFHYGANVALKPKQYLLQFHLEPPTFGRTEKRENQWLAPVDAEFTFDASVREGKIGNKELQDMKISFETEAAESMFVLEDSKQTMSMPAGQPVGMQASPPGSNTLTTILYGVFLIVGMVLGFIVSRYIQK